MTALVLLSHEPVERVHRMAEHWTRYTRPAHTLVAYGGAADRFAGLRCPAVMVADPRLRTKDHQRERQSYTGALRDVLAALPAAGWDFLYLAEFDMLPVVPDLWQRLEERSALENADLLGHRVWRLDDTLHPHYASHRATHEWMEWIGTFSCRSVGGVVLSCMGCGQFWRREALEAVVARGEAVPAYLELHLPTVAHHLGFRVRGLPDQDRFVSNEVIAGATPALMRDLGAWVVHPVKDLWSDGNRVAAAAAAETGGPAPATPAGTVAACAPGAGGAAAPGFAKGWKSDLQPVVARIAAVALGRQPVHVLRGGRRLALALPPDGKAAASVLDLYHPYRRPGQAFRAVACSYVATGAYRTVLPAHAGGGGCEVDWLAAAAEQGRVGFLGGNPAHGLRCALGGLTAGADGEPFVAKLGFDQGMTTIADEARITRHLAERHTGIPQVLSFQHGADWALLRLPNLGYRAPRHMGVPEIHGLLRDWLRDEWRDGNELPWLCDLLDQARAAGVATDWCKKMLERRYRLSLQHGDFAIWNLRLTPVGLYAIDWEWAVEHGIGGMDLAHGLRQEAAMIRRLGARRAIARIRRQAARTHWRFYLEACGWGQAHDDWLRLGLIRSHFNAESDSRALLAELGVRLGPAA